MEVKLIVEEGVKVPTYETAGAAGFDLIGTKVLKVYKGQEEIPLKIFERTIKQGYITLRGFERVLIGTGIKAEIPKGYEMQIRSRSGQALKKGLIVANQPGTIDSDYRGEIGIILLNTTDKLIKIELGERMAQAVIAKYEVADFVITESLSDTNRGEGGFGSTGNSGKEVKFE